MVKGSQGSHDKVIAILVLSSLSWQHNVQYNFYLDQHISFLKKWYLFSVMMPVFAEICVSMGMIDKTIQQLYVLRTYEKGN